jgi:hypothetical protein
VLRFLTVLPIEEEHVDGDGDHGGDEVENGEENVISERNCEVFSIFL